MSTLEELATHAISRMKLRADGYRPIARTGPLGPLAYSIRSWRRRGCAAQVLEFIPFERNGVSSDHRPRLTATTPAEAYAVRAALGLTTRRPPQAGSDDISPRLDQPADQAGTGIQSPAPPAEGE